ncbi:30S ribosomal protein S19 [archaeon]|nr:30S ribosomal protein S19 [archaeon]|tara:strand:+ start:2529 stop:2927 length:399 start_codon:yes stop_codon:yes gene_type:complete
MALKEFTFHGKTLEEIKKMDLKEFAKLIPSRKRRSLLRGFTDKQKIFYDKVKKFKEEKNTKIIKTHLRDMIVLPEMVDLMIGIHSGKEFVPIKIIPEMLGSYLGELVMTRKRVAHSAPGVGATKSSSAITAR